MNRRDFGKVSLASLLSLFLPKEFDMPDQNYSGDYYLKLLRNLYRRAGVTEPVNDFATLQRLVDTERTEYETMRSWLRLVDGRIGAEYLDLPLGVIYSSVLEENKASILIENIPQIYKHLLIWSAGRNDNVGTNSDYMTGVYNGDTGNNYTDQNFFAVDTSLTGAIGTSQSNFNCGLLAQNGRAAGDVCTSVTFIPNYSSDVFRKNSFTLATLPYGGIAMFSARWNNVSPITSIELDCNTASENIVAGSAFSFYGLK
jgi:hypothetical protein